MKMKASMEELEWCSRAIGKRQRKASDRPRTEILPDWWHKRLQNIKF